MADEQIEPSVTPVELSDDQVEQVAGGKTWTIIPIDHKVTTPRDASSGLATG